MEEAEVLRVDQPLIRSKEKRNVLERLVFSSESEEDSRNSVQSPKRQMTKSTGEPVVPRPVLSSRDKLSRGSLGKDTVVESSEILLKRKLPIAFNRANLINVSSDDISESIANDELDPLESSQPSQRTVPKPSSIKRAQTFDLRSVYPIELSDPISESSSSPTKPTPKKASQTRAASKPMARGKTVDTSNLPKYSAKDLNRVNKVTRTKEELLKEMIMNIPLTLYEQKFKKEYCHEQLTNRLGEVRHNYDNVPFISWKRRVEADYDSNKDIFIPCETKEIVESIGVMYYKAEEIIDMIQNDNFGRDLAKCENRLRQEGATKEIHIILIIEGYDQYLNKLKNFAEREYKKAVMNRLNEGGNSKYTSKEKNQLSVSEVEYMINELQVNYEVNVFPVRGNAEAIDWLVSFSYTISQALYDKYERNESIANLGRVKSGNDPRLTFIESIRQFKFMTQAKSEEVYGIYRSVTDIYKRYCTHESLGTINGKNLVPPTSDNAMRKVFTATNANDIVND